MKICHFEAKVFAKSPHDLTLRRPYNQSGGMSFLLSTLRNNRIFLNNPLGMS